jgi:hypothetical protein
MTKAFEVPFVNFSIWFAHWYFREDKQIIRPGSLIRDSSINRSIAAIVKTVLPNPRS